MLLSREVVDHLGTLFAHRSHCQGVGGAHRNAADLAQLRRVEETQRGAVLGQLEDGYLVALHCKHPRQLGRHLVQGLFLKALPALYGFLHEAGDLSSRRCRCACGHNFISESSSLSENGYVARIINHSSSEAPSQVKESLGNTHEKDTCRLQVRSAFRLRRWLAVLP